MEALHAFLRALLPAALESRSDAVDRGVAAAAASDFDALAAFVGDEQQLVLFVERAADGTLQFGPEVGYTPGSASAVLIKRARAKLREGVSVARQVQFMVLCPPAEAPAGDDAVDDEAHEEAQQEESKAEGADETLSSVYAHVHLGLSPLLRSFSATNSNRAVDTEEAEEEGGMSEALKQALPMITKRMNELEYAMRSCLTSMEIPEVQLAIDPIIAEAMQRRTGSGEQSLEELGLGEEERDVKTLNRLQAGVNRWVKEIQKVTKLDRDAGSGSVAQEVQFWHNLERALKQIQRQVEGPEVRLTLDVLKQSRRSLAIILFENDTGMQAATKRVANYMILMQDFPIAGLLAATDVPQAEEAIKQIFQHLKKIKSADEYPLTQALRLVESLSRDMTAQLASLLSGRQLMTMPYAEFEETTGACMSLFRAWDENVRQFRDLVRDLTKRRGERPPPKITYEHAALQERVEDLRSFRASHNKLRDVIERVIVAEELKEEAQRAGDDKENGPGQQLEPEEPELRKTPSVSSMQSRDVLSTLDEVKAAYQLLIGVDVLDVSREGAAALENARKLYERRIDRVEGRIIERLTDKLGAAKTADEMFRVFSKFNPLFFRHRIRGAIQQFQARLIGTVESDIEALQKIFKKSYGQSQASLMSKVRDVPPVSGAIIWARQIERQLDTYLKRVESVLGNGWEQHVEGRRLKETGLAFKKKLNTQQMFDHWMKSIQAVPSFEVTGRLFCVEERAGSGTAVNLVVNFDPQIVELFKEVRNLQWLGFRIPYTLKIIADEAKEKYPFAMALQSTLDTYKTTVVRLDDALASLLSAAIRGAQGALEEAFNKGNSVSWDSEQLQEYTSAFSQRVYELQNKVDDAMQKTAVVDDLLLDLKAGDYDATALRAKLEAVQRVVDEMNLASYSNLERWVAGVESRIDAILLDRVRAAVHAWIERFTSATPASEASWHEIVLRKHALYLQPPLEEARARWVRALHRCLAVVCNLPRIQSSRYDDSLGTSSAAAAAAAAGGGGGDEALQDFGSAADSADLAAFLQAAAARNTFADLLGPLATPDAEGVSLLASAYCAIETKMAQVDAYVQTWLHYQALWSMEADAVHAKMGRDLGRWQALLQDIHQARGTFDTAEHSRHFGPVVVDFQQVQAQVSLRYDAWHKEVLTRFGALLAEAMSGFFTQVGTMRQELEQGSVDAPTGQVVTFVTTLKRINADNEGLQRSLDELAAGEHLAQRQRFQFPPGWVWLANVQGEWDAFQQILERKNKAMEAQMAALQAKILAEDRAVAGRVSELSADWARERPARGDVPMAEAINCIALFEGRAARLHEEWSRVEAAKEALALEAAEAGRVGDALEATRSEVQSLKEVWAALNTVSDELQELKETLWTAVVPKKLRGALDAILDKLKKMPGRVQQYEAFEFTLQRVRGYKKTQALVVELRSEALKDRHWREIAKILQLQDVPLKEMSLGDLWDKEPAKHQRRLGDIFRLAQGEMALEEFLRQIREYWTAYEFDLVNYQNRCRLIRGWDELFTQLDEHTNSLLSMRQSPYFRVFEEEAAAWEDKLTRIRVILDIWIEVQRRWVYLSGILLGSADIKQQLPNEYSRFMSIDGEFVALMRKVSRTPRITELIANMPSLDHSLSRLADLLEKIQRALGEYLERQRQSFSRFYFVGDEDLLEIIGNSQDPVKIQRHLSKMFAGVASLVFDNAHAKVEALVSREGEQVPLTPLQVANVKVNDWLRLLEKGMRDALVALLRGATADNPLAAAAANEGAFTEWIDRFPSQILILASQVAWSSTVSQALAAGRHDEVQQLRERTDHWIRVLADRVLVGQLSVGVRKKHEQLITEMVHQRDVLRKLGPEATDEAFAWLSQIRYSWQGDQLELRIASAQFDYGFEYQGVGERLVQTPLTDRCYLALTQALHFRLGGNPFGPAGTGKTESVKALGAQLGRFVLVFNCDEHFDLQAMGRIFVGLCQVGAWGCFDEFNRLEERILSAVSQQILNIQQGLLQKTHEISLIGKPVQLNPNVGIFVTMNPGYAGRSNLPDNLKQLFRAIAMIEPNRELIAQVMLFSQGFKTAEQLAGKVVLLFNLCQDQLSEQPHYDFGLRAVKSVLLTAGNIKRASIAAEPQGEGDDEQTQERNFLIQSLCDNIAPKLVSEDVALFQTLLAGVFPGAKLLEGEATQLRAAIKRVCDARRLVCSDKWISKVLQLEQVQQLRHGIMMVGPSGSGKSSSWRVLLDAMEMVDGIKGEAHVIDPKAISKEALYGTLDPNTLEWTNGVFTLALRTILNNVRGEKTKRHWIVFDGDVDPEWAENLNSVLDDNKLLTLPNGERLSIPDNVRIMFEVQTLKYATLATVSRCGMVWYSEETLSLDDIFANRLRLLADDQSGQDPLQAAPMQMEAGKGAATAFGEGPEEETKGGDESEGAAANANLERVCARLLAPALERDGIAQDILLKSLEMPHVMDVTRLRLTVSFFSLLARGVTLVREYNQNHPEFPLEADRVECFMSKWMLFSLLWGVGGSLETESRAILAEAICHRTTVPLPEGMESLWDYQVALPTGEWRPWRESVPKVEIDPHRVMDTEVVITTVDTLRHEAVLRAWLDEHRPLILCGPPGSGKTMSLTSVLQGMPNFELASLNFSSATTPELILKTFEQYCVYKPTRNGWVLAPPQPDRWLVVFCDEVNLPVADAYGTQHVITFMRQVVEQGGFWRLKDLQWVRVERVQFVSACNPPTDPGRVPLSHRFLRHTPVLQVDYPVQDSLRQIYGTFNRALLKLQPALRSHGDALTEAMVDVFGANKKRFSADMAPHYVYSPRELSRWMRALYEALGQMDNVSVDLLVRLWLHEGLRLFHDRLVTPEERAWCIEQLEATARARFPSADHATALRRPVLFANWLSKQYASVEQAELRDHVESRLRVFYEEELNVPLVVFDDVLEHVLRIDRVLRQPLGHLLLVGKSGAGKTVLSRFVAWMNGLRVFQIKLSRKYTLEDFDEDLRYIMKQAGCQGEKVCFIFDESNVLDSAFLERMNALLASGEVPGLFEGDERISLMSACREAAQRESSSMLDTEEDELFREFTRNVQRNLHVVFTMNPASSDLKNRAATSPALFNRCVVDWFGDWTRQALAQVGYEFTRTLDLDSCAPEYRPPSAEAGDMIEANRLAVAAAKLGGAPDEDARYRDAVVSCLVEIHESVQRASRDQMRRHENHTFVSPRDYLDLIQHYVDLYAEKRKMLEEQQLHLNIGLDKLRETAERVEELGKSLAGKEEELEAKNKQANEKLQQMVSDQNEAEKKKADAERMGKELDERNAHVAEQKRIAEAELGEAEPALLDAQKAVSDIRKSHLDEMRSLNNPPTAVKMTLEAVCMMLGLEANSWTEIRRVLQGRDFIPDVVNFKSEDLNKDRRANVQKMLENPDFSEEKVMHANKACVALFKWIVSQLQFAGILLRIKPLRDEIAKLAEESVELTARHEEEMAKIAQLEQQIAQLKDEYAVLIGETETIKAEMASVKSKVERSTALLDSLSQENERWSAARVNFADQMSTLVGDVLLAASYTSYAGFFAFRQRQAFLGEWRDLLDRLGVSFKKGMSVVEYLCKPSERLRWHADSLPNDQLCLENAIILERFNRFPLIVDPSGQASEFLLKHLASRKVVKTSFLDASFMKQLESALRFGTCLVITDVENIDPILNPVLNREIQRTGGRTLVRLGDQDIDFSPSFSMYLTTRDSTFQFAPDVCSRVTFVNFTVTPASLQSQCLSKVLKAERPEVDKQREDLLKLQGEYQARLRELEEKLLDSLNEAQGNILDNDAVVKTLESLKQEAKEIHQKASEADQVMEKVDEVSAFYTPFASMCSRAFFALEGLAEIHFAYHFSLGFFFKALDSLLLGEEASAKLGAGGHGPRLAKLQQLFFETIYSEANHSLIEKDKPLWAVALARIKLDEQQQPGFDRSAFEALWRGPSASDPSPEAAAKALEALSPDLRAQADPQALRVALSVKPLQGLGGDLSAWAPWLSDPRPEAAANCPLAMPKEPVAAQVLKLHLVRALRRDRVLPGVTQLVSAVFGENFARSDAVDLEAAIAGTHARHPVLLLSTQGFDMSRKVETLAAASGRPLRAVAMGSPEGYGEAERAIASASQQGGWVMLKNVHLAAAWLQSLEKTMYQLHARDDFRLVLTSELSDKLPKTLLRQSLKLVFEAPKGVRASLLRSLRAMPEARMNRAPVERSRLYFLLAWFHAVLLERLRFAPIGWTKLYEFSDADQSCALDVIDEWVDRFAKGQQHIAPETIPWHAIRSILAESTYGGRIDNRFDQEILDNILAAIFVPAAFNADFVLVSSQPEPIVAPEGTTKAHFEAWVHALPADNDPSWLGLSRNAENVLLAAEGAELVAKYARLREGGPATDPEADSDDAEMVAKPKWMLKVAAVVDTWLAELRALEGLPALCERVLARTNEAVSNPIFRCFERESAVALQLLTMLRSQLGGLRQVFAGEQRMTNDLYALAHDVQRKQVPPSWAALLRFGSRSVTLDQWFADLLAKLHSFEALLQRPDWAQAPLACNLGDLFSPTAFLTATRQQAAKARDVSLESLELHALTAAAPDGAVDFEGAVLLEGLEPSKQPLNAVRFQWRAKQQENAGKTRLPLYADSSRAHLLAELWFDMPVGEGHVLRGVAMVAHLTL